MTDPGPANDDERSRLQLLSRAELESRVQARTAYLENLMDTMVDVLLELDAEGKITMANRALYDILGYEEGAVVDKPVDVVLASPDDNPQLSSMLTRGELTERLLVEGSLNDVEVYFETVDGEAIPMSLSASVMEDDEGGVSGVVCVAKDISERKEAEETAEFLHSLLRHDLGNKLQVTQGYLNLVLDQGPGAAGTEEYLEDAVAGIEEATELIENVRTLHRLDGESDPQPTHLTQAIRESVRRHEDLRKQRGFEVETDLAENLRVRAGPLVKELFANLVENAYSHSGGSRVRVTADPVDGRARTVVADDGEGIPPAEREDIFGKGVTGPDSTGTGLGMHIVARIARTYDGDVTVEESDLGGARFVVDLPLIEE
jgi:PAS domain S-box-containing protein